MFKTSLIISLQSQPVNKISNVIAAMLLLLFINYSGPDRDMIYRVFKNEDGNVPVARFIAVSNFYNICVVSAITIPLVLKFPHHPTPVEILVWVRDDIWT